VKIISLNVALPELRQLRIGSVMTAGYKTPVAQAMLRFHNFDGDRQADLSNHGGADQAVCVYPYDHYQHWESVLGERLSPGAFSENLTIDGARETEVCIGDVFGAGDALVQVSQPRQPCAKLAGKFRRKDFIGDVVGTGFSGFYVRVVKEGMVKQGDEFQLVSPHPARVTVTFVNEVLYHQRARTEDIQRVLAVRELAAGWHEMLEEYLERAA
jgi:MOSC domain-containing protein YiiM